MPTLTIDGQAVTVPCWLHRFAGRPIGGRASADVVLLGRLAALRRVPSVPRRDDRASTTGHRGLLVSG